MKFIVFNLKKLEEQIKENKMSKDYYFYYFLLSAVLVELIILYPVAPLYPYEDFIYLLSSIVYFAVTFYLYKKIKIENFIEKYLAISFVVGIRTLIFLLPVSALLFIGLGLFLEDEYIYYIVIIYLYAYASIALFRSFTRLTK